MWKGNERMKEDVDGWAGCNTRRRNLFSIYGYRVTIQNVSEFKKIQFFVNFST